MKNSQFYTILVLIMVSPGLYEPGRYQEFRQAFATAILLINGVLLVASIVMEWKKTRSTSGEVKGPSTP